MINPFVSNFLDFFNDEKHADYIFDPRSAILDGKKSVDLYEIFCPGDRDSSINFFPSPMKGGCYETAVFISFSKSPKSVKLKKTTVIHSR